MVVASLIAKLFLGAVECVCLAHCVHEYVADVVLCVGPSMEPTLCANDILIAERLSVRFGRLRRGDVVVAVCPSDPRRRVCKRLVGLPGDKLPSGIVVPPGRVWLQGDNAENSTDSRVYGPVPEALLRSRAFCKIYPFLDLSLLAPPSVRSSFANVSAME